MNRVMNSHWIDQRLGVQRPAPRAAIAVSDYGKESASRARARQFPLISPTAVFLMVILAMSALCVTATMRAGAEVNEASIRFQSISSDVEALRQTNSSLHKEVKRLKSDPRAIETAARARLGMLRPNEIVVNVE